MLIVFINQKVQNKVLVTLMNSLKLYILAFNSLKPTVR